jgi:hypothetical protein
MTSERRIALDERDFRALVAGGEVTKQDLGGDLVVIILSDIGFGRMRDAIRDAMRAQLGDAESTGLPAGDESENAKT